MTLKIAWAGPWNTKSAIATFGVEVTAALRADGHEVTVFRTELGEDMGLPVPDSPVTVHHLGGRPIAPMRREYDAIVANLGDHYGYHGALVPLLLETDAVLIFHDAYMANFCAGWAHDFPNPGAALQAMVTTAYGPGAMPPRTAYWLPLEEMARRRPMLELFAGQATAAVVHARHYQARLAALCPGPVAIIPLAFRDPDISVTPRMGEMLEVATFGYVNRNKRIGEVIKAIGGSADLREQCRYRIIGPAAPEERRWIEEEMRTHGVTNVVFTGWVSDEVLKEMLAETDVICCLRDPIFEGGSASVIVAMLAGRTVLVSDQGVYADLPDDVALKCRPGAEAADVQRHLLACLQDRDVMWARGGRARIHAQRMHSPARYARELAALIERAAPNEPALRTSMEFGRALASLGLGDDDPAVQRVIGMLNTLFGRGETGA